MSLNFLQLSKEKLMKIAEKNGKPVPQISEFEAEAMWIVNGGDPKAAFLINRIANEAANRIANEAANGGDPKAAWGVRGIVDMN